MVLQDGTPFVQHQPSIPPPRRFETDITIDDPDSEGDEYQENTEEEKKVKSCTPNGHHKQMPNNTVCIITTLRLREIVLQLI